MRIRATLFTLGLLVSISTFAAKKDAPKSCEEAAGGPRIEQGPTIEQLRAKYGLPQKPVVYAEDTSLTVAGAKFVLDTEGRPKIVLKEYPGVRFDWDSPNDHLCFKIGNYLGALRDRGDRETPEFTINFDFYHPTSGTSILNINHFDGLF